MILAAPSCKKVLDVDPPKTSLSQNNVYNNDVAAISVLTGLYHQISQDNLFAGSSSVSLMAGLSADEFTLSDQVDLTDSKRYHYIDSLFSNAIGSTGTNYWSQFYNYIFECNSAIEGLTLTTKLTKAVRDQLLGEAKFMRAFLHFCLINMYGDIPIVETTDWKVNSFLSRKGRSQVYQQIISDLTDAEGLLNPEYLDGSLQPYFNKIAERVRPIRWAATALLARVYLYNVDWVNAEAKSSLIINNSSLYALASLNEAFVKNSREAIWQVQPIVGGQNTSDGAMYLLPSTGPSSDYPVYLSPQLLSAFEPGDERRFNRNWVDSVEVGPDIYYFPYKYKEGFNSDITSVSDLTEYTMVLRLGEQFLIRAEARAQLNNITGARNDINVIRARAGLPNTTANDKVSLLNAVLHERQVELFSEWGHRWFDLKRTGNADAVMSVVRPIKANGSPWQSYMQLYPILFSDIEKNSNLLQNTGY
jgi:hypothetical protein